MADARGAGRRAEGAGAPAPAARLALVGGLAAGLYAMNGLLVPLWAVAIAARPAAVGVVAGIASLLPMLLAVPAGAWTRRVGSGRLLLLAAALAAAGALATPLAHTVAALAAVQLAGGLGRGIAWMAAQTYLVQLGGGPAGARRAVLFSTASMVGTLLSPFLVGVLVQHGGHAVAFDTVAVAYAGLAVAAVGLPGGAGGRAPSRGVRAAWSATLALATSAGMVLVLLATFLRFASGSLRLAFFPVYLHGLGLLPVAIGVFVGLGNVVSVAGVLAAAPLLPRVRPVRLLYGALVLTLGALAATPLVSAAAGLAVVSALWGLGMGLSLPALLHEIGETAGDGAHGLDMGLRTTVNEAAALLGPLALGAASAWSGIAGGFYLVGGGLSALALGGLLAARGRARVADLAARPGVAPAGVAAEPAPAGARGVLVGARGGSPGAAGPR